MITVHLTPDRFFVEGHAEKGGHIGIGVCAVVSMLAQQCACWTIDPVHRYEDADTHAALPVGETGEFVCDFILRLAAMSPENLTVIDLRKESP